MAHSWPEVPIRAPQTQAPYLQNRSNCTTWEFEMFWLSLIVLAAAAQDPPAIEETTTPTTSVLKFGNVTFLDRPKATVPQLTLNRCAPLPAHLHTPANRPEDGRVLLQLKLRKGKATLVTVTEVDKGLDWLTPCLERELAAVEWPIRKAKLEVPFHVTEDTPSAAAPPPE